MNKHKYIYTHQGHKERRGAYELPFDTFEEAQEHMSREEQKGFICWGLRKVSRHYTISRRSENE